MAARTKGTTMVVSTTGLQANLFLVPHALANIAAFNLFQTARAMVLVAHIRDRRRSVCLPARA